jgi:predicted nucleotidyltransferase
MLTHVDSASVKLPLEAIAQVCRQFGVRELAVFGSALREDFGPGSDVDFLVRFEKDDIGPWMEKLGALERALAGLPGRGVDVVNWRGIENSSNRYRRDHILQHARLIYAA